MGNSISQLFPRDKGQKNEGPHRGDGEQRNPGPGLSNQGRSSRYSNISQLFRGKGHGNEGPHHGDGEHRNPPGQGSSDKDIPPVTPVEGTVRGSTDWGSGFSDGGETDIEANRETDVVVEKFDKEMEKKAEQVLGSLEKGMHSGGLEPAGGLQLACLKDVTEGLVDMDSEVGNVILNFDQAVWANPEMKELVIQFFKHSKEALEFCHVMESSVQKARDNQMWIEHAVGILPQDRDPTEEECRKILQELREFATAENPFSDFTRRFYEVYDKQKEFHARLEDRMKRLKRRERMFNTLRKVTRVMLTATGISLVIFAAVAMALAAPLVPNLSVRAAAALPVDQMRSSLRNLWRGYEERMRREKEAMDTARWSTYVAILDLETIQMEVTRLESGIKSIIESIEFGQKRGDPVAVQQIIPRIKRKQADFVTQLDELSTSIRMAFDRLNSTRGMVLERITPVRTNAGSGSTRHGGE